MSAEDLGNGRLRGGHRNGKGGSAAAGSGALQRLGALLRGQGGLMADLLPAERLPEEQAAAARAGEEAGPASLACAGPRVRDGAAGEYELLLETIYEGYLLHYGTPRLLRPPDADLGLLAGDRLYALGLARLVALGDLVAVAELADVITLTALAHGAGSEALAGAVWDAGALAVGWGPTEEHARAKALARSGAPDALEAMRALAAVAPGSAR
jgi:hypothetical protein